MTGLSIGDVVAVSVNLTPLAAAARNLSNLLILGSTPNVIDTTERMRSYTTSTAVAADFGSTAPEYLAASLYFQQVPQPASLYIATFAQVATSGRLFGAPLSAAQQVLANFTAITTGSLEVNIDGVNVTKTTINLSTAANLNAVATLVTTALAGAATCVWDAAHSRFEITSTTTGITSDIGFSIAPGSGTDIGPLMLLRAIDSGSRVAQGAALETPLAGVIACASFSNDWYALMTAPVTPLVDADRIAIAGFIESANPVRIQGVTTAAAAVPDPTQTTDIASLLKTANYNRTLVQYSNTPYAVASLLGRVLTVDFTGNNTAITLKFKNEPGVTAETLTESQAAALASKNCNVFVNYQNATALIQNGVMSGGNFIDEEQGMDWLQNAVQTAIYNLLYTSPTKVPQTDAGSNLIVATCEAVMAQAVINGLVAPGVWSSTGFGALVQNQTLPKGYYIYCAPIATQATGDRALRKAPPIQIAAKLAGAVHSAGIAITVNR